jgi:hypothetical protein
MNSYQKRTFQAFRRVQGWLVTHPELAAPNSHPGISPDGVAQQVVAFNQIVDQIPGLAAEQEAQDREIRGAARETTRSRRSLVGHHMRHISIIAETAMPDVVRMTEALKRPRGRDAESLIAAADAMAKAAGQYKTELVQRGLPADFIKQLQRAAESYKRAIDLRGAAMGRRVVASSAVETAVRRGAALVRALSVLVERRFALDANLLAEWEQLKHVVHVGSRPLVVETGASPVQTASSPVQAGQSAPKAAAA